jgi:hypothetical protein
MIDPKLDKVPVDPASKAKSAQASEQRQSGSPNLRHAREGLSITDTIAGDANLSVGSRGVEVSGVETGSGAGAGLTSTSPTRSGSPAPTIVPPGRGSGTTPRSTSALTQDTSPDLLERSTATSVSQEEVSARAYRCWHERGCPDGSPEVDWRRAEQELEQERKRGRGFSAGA